MRTDHYVGLNKWAKAFVNRTRTIREVGVELDVATGKLVGKFDRCKRIPLYRKVASNHIPFTFADTGKFADLFRYYLPDGTWLEEFVEKAPWAGGPWHYIALTDNLGNVVPQSLWGENE